MLTFIRIISIDVGKGCVNVLVFSNGDFIQRFSKEGGVVILVLDEDLHCHTRCKQVRK